MRGPRSTAHKMGKPLLLCLVVLLTLATGTSAGPAVGDLPQSWRHDGAARRDSFPPHTFGTAHRSYRDLSGKAGASTYFEKTSSALQAELSNGDEADFLIVLAEQADLSHVAALGTKEAKGRAV